VTDLAPLLETLRASRFRELAGARLSGTIPVAESLLNSLVAATLPAHAPVRSVTLHPEAADGLSVRITAKAALIPPITLKLAIESQPQLPGSPILTLRMVTLGGLFGLASGAIAGMLPPGVTLAGERILIDLGALARQRGHGEIFEYLQRLEVHTEQGRLLLHLDAGVS
jgi:hypothetical protein